MTSNTLVSLNKIRRFHPKRDSENDVHPSLCPFRETKFLIFRDMKKNEMQTYTRVVREKERLLLLLSLSLCEQKRIVRSASHKAQKKRSQYVPLTRRNLLRINMTRNQKFARDRERKEGLGFKVKTLNKKKRPINLRTFPSRTLDFRLTLARKNTHHHEHESFTINRGATARGVIAPVSERVGFFGENSSTRE